jgi:hypothetical protein
LRRFLLIACALAACFISQPGLAQTAAAPAPPRELTAEQWREDLRFMTAEMRTRHPNLYHEVSKAEFESAVASLDARIPQLRRNQIIVEMMRIAAMVGDGHTRIEPRKDQAFLFPSLPVKLYLFDDGVFVRAARADQRALLGARVEAIGGVSIDEAVRRVTALASRENASGAKLYVPIYLAMPDVLHAVGLATGRDHASLTLSRDGRRWSARLPAGDIDPRWPPDTDISLITPEGWVDANGSAVPMWLEAPLDYHRLIDLRGRNALYAQLNMVTNIDGQTLDQFGDKIFTRSQATNPRVIVLDLRLNQGGNGMLRTGLVKSLIKAEDADTRLAILTARGTFSASQFILNDLERLTNASLVGEPAGSKPSHYGDSYRSVMPNSGITVRTSIIHWQHEQDDRKWNSIDVAVPYQFADYATGRDPVLEAALVEPQPKSLRAQLEEAATAVGADGLAAAFDRVADDPVNRYADLHHAATGAVMTLSRVEGVGIKAVVAARWAARKHPDSSIAATVLAMVAEQQGQKSEALSAARNALRLDRNNRNARSIADRLTQ